MSDPTAIQIRGEPISASKCKFVVDRPLFEGRGYFFGKAETAAGSPLAERLFAIPGVTEVLIAHNTVTVAKGNSEDWPIIGKQIGAAIREFAASGEPAVNSQRIDDLPSEDELRNRVEQVLEAQVNPFVATHGGVVRLIDVRENTIFLQMGGGCQGCGMAGVTLRQGVEVAIRAVVPEVGEILDTTDHAAGRNPYYAANAR